MKQAEVAKVLGVSATALSQKETGKRPFTAREAVQLMYLFKCQFEDLFNIIKEEQE